MYFVVYFSGMFVSGVFLFYNQFDVFWAKKARKTHLEH